MGNLLADMATKVHASRLLVLDAAAASTRAAGRTCEAGMAKLFASEACMQVALDAMRIRRHRLLGRGGHRALLPDAR